MLSAGSGEVRGRRTGGRLHCKAKGRDEAEAKDELENDEAEKTEATGREAKTELKE